MPACGLPSAPAVASRPSRWPVRYSTSAAVNAAIKAPSERSNLMGQLQVPLMSTRPDAASQEPGIALIDDGPLPSVVRLCNRLSVHRLGSMQGRSTGQSRKTRPMYLAIHMRALSRLPCERRHAPYRDGYRAVSTATQSIETRRSVRAAIAYLCATNGRRRTSAHAAVSAHSCR